MSNETSSRSRDDQVDGLIAAYLEAVDRGEPPDRDQFLAEHVEYAAELQSFFANQAQFGQAAKQEPRPIDRGNTATFLAPSAEEGSVIGGRYTLLQRIGEGGMGTVWVAKQTEPLKRKVALKLIKLGMDSKAVVQRFEQERQALALMDHPNIAKVLDGGISDDGRPFFVMELVNGLPLTKFCDQALLTPRARLELFVPICQAVQHAHQKGIIHRDLKPANILITMIDGNPIPKVIDFGVAKAIGGKLTDESLSTQFGAVVGTLEYMSPEQAGFSGVDVDTRADIYSLGVILYELLTGLRPIDANRLKKAALVELIRIIQEEEPSKPSTRLSTDESLASMAALRHTEPRKLMAMLRGELDWVVMKCLEKHRERRYETANGLAKDIQRFLDDETVEARPPSAVYRWQKFWRRNKGPILATSVVILAVLGGLTAVLAVQRRANADLSAKNQELADEQVKVQARFELAQKAIKTFHTGVSEDLLLKQVQFKELRNRLLKEAAGFYGELEKLLEGQLDIRSRRALSAAYFQLGDLTDKIGEKSQALAVHREGLAVRRELASAPGADVETRLDVSRSLLRVGQLLNATGDTVGALAAMEEQRNLAERLAQEESPDSARAVLAQGYNALGLVLKETGNSERALTAFETAVAIQQKLADANSEITEFQSYLAEIQIEIGRLLNDFLSKPVEAIAVTERAKLTFQKLVDMNPGNIEFQNHLARSYNIIGLASLNIGNSSAAGAAFDRTLAIRQRLIDANPSVTEFQRHMGVVNTNIARLKRGDGKA